MKSEEIRRKVIKRRAWFCCLSVFVMRFSRIEDPQDLAQVVHQDSAGHSLVLLLRAPRSLEHYVLLQEREASELLSASQDTF